MESTGSSADALTVADGSECVIVLDALTHHPPLGEDGVGAQGIHVEAAPGAHQVVRADVTCAAADGEVPVGQSEGRVLQHVLVVSWRGKSRLCCENVKIRNNYRSQD